MRFIEELSTSKNITQSVMKFPSRIKFFFFLGLAISGCNSDTEKINKFDFTKEVWIYDSPSMPDSIKNFTDNFIIFDSTEVSMNYDNLGEYTITNDTLRIFQTSYIEQRGGKYQKRISDQFVGLIIKMDSTQILIKPIRGYFPIKYKCSFGHFDKSKTIRLTNQKSKKKKQINFNYISIASSSCYGTCPVYNLELYNNGSIKFHCSSYCKKIGYFEGKLTSDDLNNVKDFISYLNLKNDSTIFDTPEDASIAAVELKVDNRKFHFYGSPREFQYKLNELMHELFSIVEKSKLNKTKKILTFKTNLPEPPIEKTIEFIPPIVQD